MRETSIVNLSSIVVQSATPLSAQVAGRTVLMSTEQGKYYDLDTISTAVWQHLSAPIAVTTLCAALAEQYEGDQTTIQSDVLTLLSTFLDHGLIDVHVG